MPRQYKKQYRRKAKPRTRYQNYAGAAGQLYKDVKYLKRIVNVEHKLFELDKVKNPTSTGEIFFLNKIPQGDTDVTRDGSSVKLQHLKVIGNIQNSKGIDTSCRVIIYWDEANTITSVYGAADGFFLSAVLPGYDFKNWNTRFKTSVLYDKTFELSVANSSASVGSGVRKHLEIDLNIGKHTQFLDATGEISSGALKLLIVSNATTSGPVFSYNQRLTYTDN